MRRTMATAGRTVLFSSLTVAGALASLVVFPQRFLYSMGIGGSLVALIAAAIALLVLPAILALLGERVNSLSPAFLRDRAARDARPASAGFWYRLSQLVMRFPARIAIASAAFLIALGIPFLSINFTSVDAQVLPESASARQVDDSAARRLPALPRLADRACGRRRRPPGCGGARRSGRPRARRRLRSIRRSRSTARATRSRRSRPSRRSATRASSWWSACAGYRRAPR